MKRNPVIEAVRDELEKHGARFLRVEAGGRHARIIYEWQGAERFKVVTGSVAKTGSCENAREDIRHALGVVGGPKRIGNRRRKRARLRYNEALAPERISIKADPFGVVINSPIGPAVREYQLQVAFRRFWRDCMAKVGGASLLSEAP